MVLIGVTWRWLHGDGALICESPGPVNVEFLEWLGVGRQTFVYKRAKEESVGFAPPVLSESGMVWKHVVWGFWYFIQGKDCVCRALAQKIMPSSGLETMVVVEKCIESGWEKTPSELFFKLNYFAQEELFANKSAWSASLVWTCLFHLMWPELVMTSYCHALLVCIQLFLFLGIMK